MLETPRFGLRSLIARLRCDQVGTAMVEYGLLVGVIALVVSAGASHVGGDISTMFNGIDNYLATLPTTP
jgi:Flp pilus assembly pilin Flp